MDGTNTAIENSRIHRDGEKILDIRSSKLPPTSELPPPAEWKPPSGWSLSSEWALPLFAFGPEAWTS